MDDSEYLQSLAGNAGCLGVSGLIQQNAYQQLAQLGTQHMQDGELQKLREEYRLANQRIMELLEESVEVKAENARLHAELAQRMDPGGEEPDRNTWRELKEENARLKEQVTRLQELKASENHPALVNECKRLRMELADVRGGLEECELRYDRDRSELNWCKREISRLDPRLARARWGGK